MPRRKLPDAMTLRRWMAARIPAQAIPFAELDGLLYRVVELEEELGEVMVPGFKLPQRVVIFKLEKLKANEHRKERI